MIEHNPDFEAALILIKPDATFKSLEGPILTKLAKAELTIVASKVTSVTRELAETHYENIKDKPFFEETIEFITGKLHANRVMAFVLYGKEANAKIRKICGATNPEDAAPDSIRGSFGRITTKGVYENVIHASEDAPHAEREIKLWFNPDELIVSGLYDSKATEGTVRVWS